MSLPTILVTGGSGMVGAQVDFGIKPTHAELDITDKESVRRAFLKYRPDVVLHLASYIDMVGCERDPERAHLVNVEGTRNIAKACRDAGARFVYVSTCALFDGAKEGAYLESDPVHPLSVYGRTKYEGELVAQEVIPDVLIVRTGWLFGGGKERDKKFVGTTFRKLSAGEEMRVTDDRFGSPTYIPDFVRAVHDLTLKGEKGVVHVVNSGAPTSYVDIANVVKEAGNLPGTIIPASCVETDSKEVIRGRMEALASERVTLRSWKEALKEYISSFR